MTKQLLQRSLAAAVAGGVALLAASKAHAVSPLEYPDNGAAQFSRGGAWLATGNEPIAAHYNPAALATQKSAFSIDLNMNFNKVCFDRRVPGNGPAGPTQDVKDSTTGYPALIYLPACSERSSFPNTIPSLALAWRATSKLALGFAILPPSAYGTADRTHGATAQGYNLITRQYQAVPAPWRYMTVRELSTILYPTFSVGYELFKNFRLGVGFVSGIAIINTQSVGISNAQSAATASGDHSIDDATTILRTKDLFVPGVVASLHWSVLPQLDVSVWGRYMDSIRTSNAALINEQQSYNQEGQKSPQCLEADLAKCPGGQGAINNFPESTKPVQSFVYGLPPELRVGFRFHLPRSKSRFAFDGKEGVVRDPLHDDLFDVELNGSYTANSTFDHIEVRIRPAVLVQPTAVQLPQNADRPTGYKDSYGVRLGGQWNVIQDKLGIRAGGWYETQSQDPALLNMGAVGGAKFGFGGGLVFRQDFLDISIGYQRVQMQALDNKGNGALYVPAASNGNDFRSWQAVNGGRLTQSAHAFSIGGTIRF